MSETSLKTGSNVVSLGWTAPQRPRDVACDPPRAPASLPELTDVWPEALRAYLRQQIAEAGSQAEREAAVKLASELAKKVG